MIHVCTIELLTWKIWFDGSSTKISTEAGVVIAWWAKNVHVNVARFHLH